MRSQSPTDNKKFELLYPNYSGEAVVIMPIRMPVDDYPPREGAMYRYAGGVFSKCGDLNNPETELYKPIVMNRNINIDANLKLDRDLFELPESVISEESDQGSMTPESSIEQRGVMDNFEVGMAEISDLMDESNAFVEEVGQQRIQDSFWIIQNYSDLLRTHCNQWIAVNSHIVRYHASSYEELLRDIEKSNGNISDYAIRLVINDYMDSELAHDVKP